MILLARYRPVVSARSPRPSMPTTAGFGLVFAGSLTPPCTLGYDGLRKVQSPGRLAPDIAAPVTNTRQRLGDSCVSERPVTLLPRMPPRVVDVAPGLQSSSRGSRPPG